MPGPAKIDKLAHKISPHLSNLLHHNKWSDEAIIMYNDTPTINEQFNKQTYTTYRK